jgi:hypothetical protein
MTRENRFRSGLRRGARAPKGVYFIREPKQLAAIRSPVRQEIVDVLAATGVRTVAEIASMLGRSPHSLYHHVRLLERVGLLLNMGLERRNRRDEALYATPGRRLRLHHDLVSPKFLRNMRGLVAGMLRLTERDFVRALARRVPTKVAPSINLVARRMKGRLTTGQLREVRRLVGRLHDLLGNHPEQTVGTMYALTMVIAPLAEHARKKAGGPRRSTPNQRNARATRARAGRSTTVDLKGAGT